MKGSGFFNSFRGKHDHTPGAQKDSAQCSVSMRIFFFSIRITFFFFFKLLGKLLLIPYKKGIISATLYHLNDLKSFMAINILQKDIQNFCAVSPILADFIYFKYIFLYSPINS